MMACLYARVVIVSRFAVQSTSRERRRASGALPKPERNADRTFAVSQQASSRKGLQLWFWEAKEGGGQTTNEHWQPARREIVVVLLLSRLPYRTPTRGRERNEAADVTSPASPCRTGWDPPLLRPWKGRENSA